MYRKSQLPPPMSPPSLPQPPPQPKLHPTHQHPNLTTTTATTYPTIIDRCSHCGGFQNSSTSNNPQESLGNISGKSLLGKLPPISYQKCSTLSLDAGLGGIGTVISGSNEFTATIYDHNHNQMVHIMDYRKSIQNSNENSSKSIDFDEKSSQNENQSNSGFTFKIVLSTVVALLTNSFPSGYNLGVVNTPQDTFISFFNSTLNGANSSEDEPITPKQIEFYWSIAVSLLIVGAVLGSAITGYLADTIGRRGLLFTNSMIGIAGISMCWISKFLPNVPMFYGGRLIAGIHTGIASSLVPMYLMEIAPKSLVSCLGSIHVMGLTIGLLIGQIFGLETVLGSEPRWHMLFIVNSIFILVGLIFIFMCPESPVYLFVLKKKEEEAIEVLKSVRGKHDLADLADDIDILKQEQKTKECNNLSFLELLMQKSGAGDDGKGSFRRNLLIVCALHAGQQLVGINAIFYYSTMTFKSVGLSPQHSQMGSIACAFLNALSALLSIPLVRRFSPRRLLLVSSSSTIACLLMLTISMTFNDRLKWLNYVTIAVILIYVFLFAIGQGPIPYMIGGELFDRASMAIGLSCGCLANWLCNCLIALAFPSMVLLISQYVFLVFVIFDFLFLLLVIFIVPDRIKPQQAQQFKPPQSINTITNIPNPCNDSLSSKSSSFDTIATNSDTSSSLGTDTTTGSSSSLIKY